MIGRLVPAGVCELTVDLTLKDSRMAEAIASGETNSKRILKRCASSPVSRDGRWSVLRLEWPNLYVRVTSRNWTDAHPQLPPRMRGLSEYSHSLSAGPLPTSRRLAAGRHPRARVLRALSMP